VLTILFAIVLSQVSALFDHWEASSDIEGGGFEAHVSSVCNFYKSQRDAFLNAADTHLTGLAEWNRCSLICLNKRDELEIVDKSLF
jgi:DNA-binding transcriptional MocR family regulator